MATYYCIHGATHNGDGTAANEAASGGAAGAFNDAEAVLEGTEPGLGAKPYDVIFKTHHNGADITIVRTADITIAYGVGSSETINYIFDDGEVWGEDGVFAIELQNGAGITRVSGSSVGTVNPSCNIIGKGNYNFQIHINYVGTASFFVSFHEGVVSNVWIKYIMATPITGQVRCSVTSGRYNRCLLLNIKRDWSQHGVMHVSPCFVTDLSRANPPTRMDVKGCLINMLETIDQGTGINVGNLLNNGALGEDIQLVGQINTYALSVGNPINRFSYVNGMNIDTNGCSMVKKIGNQETYDFKETEDGLTVKWEFGKNYPTRNALLRDGITPWSVLCDAFDIVDGTPHVIYNNIKYYGDSSAIKTITVDLLIPDTISNPTNQGWFLNLSYTNVNDGLENVSSYSDTLLETSTALWSSNPPSYGPVQFNTYKITLTTPTAVKQGSNINVSLYTTVKGANVDEVYFVDPEFEIT